MTSQNTMCLTRRDSRAASCAAAAPRFRNDTPAPRSDFLSTLGIMWKFLFNKPSDTVPAGAIPVEALSSEALLAAPDRTIYRLGHSTLLIKLRDAFWLTDPVFSERASPVQWMGPKRFHQSPIALEALPPIKGVILSHDHYDHLNYDTIKQLAPKVEHFLTPLGVGDRLIAWGVDAAKVRQLNWWECASIEGLRFVATPAQHFSGRGLNDGNRTLWASCVMIDGAKRVFFSGDSGYFAGFREIGERYGPFDLTLIETGAYNEDWPYVHMQPEQSLQAHVDLKGKWMMPIHNGTFDLALHAWNEPFDRIAKLADRAGVSLTTPRIGEALSLAAPHTGERWWRAIP
jgi:L-ascorbate metabolism protein UlaG (beta-lactamase superfamily)